MTYLGKEGFTWGKGLSRFSLHLKSTFHLLLQVYYVTQKMHISQELAFLSITLQCHET